MKFRTREYVVTGLLIVYLAVIGIGAGILIVVNFPHRDDANKYEFDKIAGTSTLDLKPFGFLNSSEQGLAYLALLAGIVGSFIHAAQSLSTFLGNRAFRISWASWYLFRPWIGGTLGLAIYFVIGAGLLAGSDNLNPFSVVALGLLGGWFSKTTTDKLQEVFETLFQTDADEKRKDKLDEGRDGKPVIELIEPQQITAETAEILIKGRNFVEGAEVEIGKATLSAEFISDSELSVSLDGLEERPEGINVEIRVLNGADQRSDPHQIAFL